MSTNTDQPQPSEVLFETAARAAHEANRAWCMWCGDLTQQPWGDAPKWQRDSAIAGVRWLWCNPMANPIDQHEEWCRHKRAAGWVYGSEKNADRLTHPCLLPYHELPIEQRAKDVIFAGVVRAIFKAASKKD